MALDFSRCAVGGRARRVFWATQPDCGQTPVCPSPTGIVGETCASSGLRIDCIPDPCSLGCNDACPPKILGATIANTDWVRGLVLNILLTDARLEDSECGFRPGTRGGHWSESFRPDGRYNGTRMRQVETDCSVSETLQLIEGYIEDDLSRLVTWGVVSSVSVSATYSGSNRVSVDVLVYGEREEEIRVGVTGTRLKNGWVWGTTA